MNAPATLTANQRFHRALSFESVDALPAVEFAPWWDVTLERWHREGLPRKLDPVIEIESWFGLDPMPRVRQNLYRDTCPPLGVGGEPLMAQQSLDGYRRLKPHLYPEPAFDVPTYRRLVRRRDRHGDIVIWVALEGFFWFPRSLMGVENHLMAFYGEPELMHAINEDLLAFHTRTLDAMLAIGAPDCLTLAEDLAFNHGPMIGEPLFREFLTPYYHRLLPRLCELPTKVFMDSDGDIAAIIPWLLDAGFQGIMPLERMAGVDVQRLRQEYPKLLMLGGFDKTVMKHGPDAIRDELDRLAPTIHRGGFIPSVDHQTPSDVSLAHYQGYARLLREHVSLPERLSGNLT